jgi:hypothetical protein
MDYQRKPVSNVGDRYVIELGEARMLYRTYETTKQKVLTPVRIKWLDKTYGFGAAERIKNLMKKLQSGELD